MLIKIRSLFHKYSYIFFSVIIQSFGTLSSMLMITLIAKLQGPEQQGYFSQVKSYFEMFLAIGLLGLPQSFMYSINKKEATKHQIFKFSNYYIFVFTVLAFITYNLAVCIFGESIFDLKRSVILILVGALVGNLAQKLWRSIYITYDAKIPFAIFTILPNVFLFFIVGIFAYLNLSQYEYAYLFSSAILIIASIIFMLPALRGYMPPLQKLKLGNIFKYSGLTFISQFLIALQLILCYRYINYFGGNNKDIAFLSSSYYLFQIPALILAMLSPLLFNYLSSGEGNKNALIYMNLKALGIFGILLSALIYLTSPLLVSLFFGDEYQSINLYIRILCIALTPSIISRVIMVAVDTSGLFRLNTFGSVLRLILIFITAFCLKYFEYDNVMSLIVGITVSEIVAGLLYIYILKFIK